MNSPNVRAIRFELAEALFEADQTSSEAVMQLRSALGEPGAEPPDWEIRLEIGRAKLRIDDASAFGEFLQSVLAAPEEKVDEPAAEALEAIRDMADKDLASLIDDDFLKELSNRAAYSHSDRFLELVVQLAVRLGNRESIGRFLSIADESETSSLALKRAELLATSLRLLEEGDAEAVLKLKVPVTDHDGDNQDDIEDALLAVRGLALYAIGEDESALQIALSGDRDYNSVVLECLVLLKRMSEEPVGERSGLARQATDAAVVAARLDLGHVGSLLLRSQVMLESGQDIPEGQRLLRNALAASSNSEPQDLWWKVQRQRREQQPDTSFQYYLLELAATVEDHDKVIRIAQSMDLAVAEHTQVAAIHERKAEALQVKEASHSDVADSFRASSSEYSAIDDVAAALRTIRRANVARRTGVGDLDEAELTWRSTFTQNVSVEDARAALTTSLDRLASGGPASLSEDVYRHTYLTGLVESRLAELGTDSDMASRSGGVANLILAALLNPMDWFPQAHAVWALQQAELYGAGAIFAESVYQLAPAEAWPQETFVVGSINWYGTMSVDAKRAFNDLAPTVDKAWVDTVAGTQAIFAQNLDDLEPLVDGMEWQSGWGRAVAACSQALLGNVDLARNLMAGIVEQSDPGPRDLDGHVEAYLVLDEPSQAAEWLERARREPGSIDSEYLAFLSALTTMVDRRRRKASRRATATIRTISRPYRLYSIGYLLLPALQACVPRMNEAFGELARECEARLAKIPDSPSLQAGMDRPEWQQFEAKSPAIEVMLKIAEAMFARDVDGALRLSQTDDLPGVSEEALALLTSQLRTGGGVLQS